MQPGLIIIIAIVSAILSFAVSFLLLKWWFSRKYAEWQIIERASLDAERKSIRKQAITQSRAVLGGRFTEQMAPYLPEFKYDPTEARFIGSPVDMMVFPGLSQGEPTEIIIMEIKNGPCAQLTPVERKIQRLVEEGMVRWELLERSGEQSSLDEDLQP
ncbi:MAG: Holliday junction resolvase [Dehalococcoidaceae bacterium]|nr:Holliday junction resolvase [Dehalococcoidaceae bacterium]